MTDEIVYVCRNYRCGTRFTLAESGTFNDNGELVAVCPDCGSSDIEEGRRCKICGDIFLESELDDGACEECFNIAVDSLGKAIENGLQPWEKELLEDRYGNLNVTQL